MLNNFKFLVVFVAMLLASACQMSGGSDSKNGPDIDPNKKLVLKDDMLTLQDENIFWNVSSPSKTLQFSLSKDYGNPKDTKYNIKAVALDESGHEKTSTCLKVADFTIQGNNTVSVPVTGVVQECTETLGFYVNNVKQQQTAKFYIGSVRNLEFVNKDKPVTIAFLDDNADNSITLRISGMIKNEPSHEVVVTSENPDIRFVVGATETKEARCTLSLSTNICDLKYKLVNSAESNSLGIDTSSAFRFIANGSNIGVKSPEVNIYHCDGDQKLYFDDKQVGLKNGLFSTKLVYCPTTDDTEHSIVFSERSENIKLPITDSIKVSADNRVVDVDFSLKNASNVSTLKDPTPPPKILTVIADLDKKDSGISAQIDLSANKPTVTISKPLITLHKGGGTATATVSCSGTIIGSSLSVKFKNDNFNVTPAVNLSSCSAGSGTQVTITTKADAKPGNYDLFEATTDADDYVVNEKDKAQLKIIDLPNISVSPDHVNLHAHKNKLGTAEIIYGKSFYLVMEGNGNKDNVYLSAPTKKSITGSILKDPDNPNIKETCDITSSPSTCKCNFANTTKCVFVVSVAATPDNVSGENSLSTEYSDVSVFLSEDGSLLKKIPLNQEALLNKFSFAGITILTKIGKQEYLDGLNVMTKKIPVSLYDNKIITNPNYIFSSSDITTSSSNAHCTSKKQCDISFENYNLQTYDDKSALVTLPQFDINYATNPDDIEPTVTCNFINPHSDKGVFIVDSVKCVDHNDGGTEFDATITKQSGGNIEITI